MQISFYVFHCWLNCLRCLLYIAWLELALARDFMEYNDKDLFEGDIKQHRRRFLGQYRNALKFSQYPEYQWPNAEVPYTVTGSSFDSNFWLAFEAALAEIHSDTCVRFRPKTAGDTEYVDFQALNGCWSYVGRQPGMPGGQLVSLAGRCWDKGPIQHELMHVLGFFHEHSRYDRDNYIEILWDNIRSDRERQFEKRPSSMADLLGDYDYGSILHYAEDAFAITVPANLKTIRVLKDGAQIGQREGVSALDLEKINSLYKCPAPTNAAQGPTCAVTQTCSDNYPSDCEQWALDGWCERQPGYMLYECKKSCCNCNLTKCFDTVDASLQQRFCSPPSSNPNLDVCRSPTTFRDAFEYCPKHCKRC